MAAATDFPWDLVTVRLQNYTFGSSINVSRTGFESGLVEQKKLFTRDTRIRRFQIDIKLSNMPQFDKWLSANASSYFNFHDFEDDYTRECRIIGGAAAVQLEIADGFLDGEKFASATIQLESVGS